MASNLPPGVTTRMIPGNTPEDEAYEKLYDEICNLKSTGGADFNDVLTEFIMGKMIACEKHGYDMAQQEAAMERELIVDKSLKHRMHLIEINGEMG